MNSLDRLDKISIVLLSLQFILSLLLFIYVCVEGILELSLTGAPLHHWLLGTDQSLTAILGAQYRVYLLAFVAFALLLASATLLYDYFKAEEK
jgi:hypothetical protein